MDEVIIQEMVDNISVSGVIFTHEIKNVPLLLYKL